MTALDALPLGAGVGLAALVGLIFGSFIATLVLRWPDGRSVLGRSRCDACERALSPFDLVPLASTLWLRGRCRRCGARIDPFHMQVELAAGLIGGIALTLFPGTAGWLWALFGWMLLPLALLDARHMWLPDRLNAALAIVGLLLAGPLLGTNLLDRWTGAIAGGALLALIALAWRRGRGREGMGGGDPKLAAAIGAWIGWQALPLTILLASAGGIVWALFTQGKGDRPLSLRAIPFGVFLSIAAWATVPLWRALSAG
ncbi:MAG TPA: A24 family peptidase [Sphingopyxis sp.]|nr:A24 family peptidase [Sphingopyxis sp.]HMP45098.1 A24 family peptidase [Sphingopyxis sp.]HMQ20566.1 A24 family peptidase [Sphingopyxis sp.]